MPPRAKNNRERAEFLAKIIENTLVLLICDGDKASQQADIELAKAYCREYKETHQ